MILHVVYVHRVKMNVYSFRLACENVSASENNLDKASGSDDNDWREEKLKFSTQ